MPKKKEMMHLPLIPLRGLMVFPHMVLHFDVGRPRSVAALEQAMVEEQLVFLVAQKDGDVEEPAVSDLCQVGTVALIKQVLNLPGDSIRVLVEGQHRALLHAVTQEEPYWEADVIVPPQDVPETPEIEALVREKAQAAKDGEDEFEGDEDGLDIRLMDDEDEEGQLDLEGLGGDDE